MAWCLLKCIRADCSFWFQALTLWQSPLTSHTDSAGLFERLRELGSRRAQIELKLPGLNSPEPQLTAPVTSTMEEDSNYDFTVKILPTEQLKFQKLMEEGENGLDISCFTESQ
ncbi:hypothetical protein AVEN_78513-1 [Araneus ventricosus]|uniref:Uncharacterized protein n=1 Tax=Araneus ventricosus TaxID=182803 RepID=A0A4Y2EQG3_ARAVE|nr:hypothetical protein AVEN_78513-1 [Araneus ventricosus]